MESIFSHLFLKMSAMAGGGGIYNNPTSLIVSPDGGPMSGTENSLWIDQKYETMDSLYHSWVRHQVNQSKK